jgi:tetratricopeptide (TPR) repeat protein
MPQPPKKNSNRKRSATAKPVEQRIAESSLSGRENFFAAGVCILLVALVWVVFGQTLGHQFLQWDDFPYVFQNEQVNRGLTWGGIVWAFTHSHSANWHPLTWISHALDCQFYGLNPGLHHLTNVILHATTSVLLFLGLRNMTGSLKRSAFVAAIFAIHPLHVESVAWLAERKDVLSGLFLVLTLGAYVRYARRAPSMASYTAVMLLFACGLMCKPSLVTLPVLLLLLDWWPLGRFSAGPVVSGKQGIQEEQIYIATRRRLVLEKIPLLLLSAASIFATLVVQHEAVVPVHAFPLSERISNAIVSYAAYLGQLFFPVNLAAYYPYPAGGWPVLEVSGAVILLLMISLGVFWQKNKRPWLICGWLWYLIMLLPMIGLIQVGEQARADRYTYLSLIGPTISITWLCAEWCASRRGRSYAPGFVALAVVMTLTILARVQTSYWKNNESLWTHALSVTSNNGFAHYNLGTSQLEKNDVEAALGEFRKALETKPDLWDAEYSIGNICLKSGRPEEAIPHYQKAISLNGRDAEALYNLGVCFAQTGDFPEAMSAYQKALEIKTNYAAANNNLAALLARNGRLDEAIACFEKAVRDKPDYADARCNLAVLLSRTGRVPEAVVQWHKALETDPDNVSAMNKLAWTLATCPDDAVRNGDEALELAQKAARGAGAQNPSILRTLAACYAETRHYDEATRIANQALEFARTETGSSLAANLEADIRLFEAGSPARDYTMKKP